MKPTIFLDRDGVINEDGGFVHKVEDFRFLQGTASALQGLVAAGFQLIVVTNQSGIGRGYYGEAEFEGLTEWMKDQLNAAGAPITAVYHCPHAPDAACDCRKPEPGMILQAIDEHNVEVESSWMIGDKPSDMEAARRAGVANRALVRTGKFKGTVCTQDGVTVFESLADFAENASLTSKA